MARSLIAEPLTDNVIFMHARRRSLTEPEAARLNAQVPDSFADHVRFHEDLTVDDGPLAFDTVSLEQSLIVIGDVNCRKTLSVPRHRRLVVTGNLVAGSIFAEGQIIVLGELDAGDVYGDSFCDQVFCCKGNARIRCLIENGHDFEFAGDLTGKCVASLHNVVRIAGNNHVQMNYLGGMKDDLRRELFATEAFDAGGTLRGHLILEHMLRGSSLLR